MTRIVDLYMREDEENFFVPYLDALILDRASHHGLTRYHENRWSKPQ